jgi:putative membrane protein
MLDFVWPWNPVGLIFLVLLCLLYGIALRKAYQRNPGEAASRWRMGNFVAGVVICALLLLTPIETLGRTQLFTVHAAQIVMLTTAVAPLLLLGWPRGGSGEKTLLQAALRWLTKPLVASIIFNVTFLAWHIPPLFALAQQNEVLYGTMMVSITATALLNWWPLIDARMSYPLQIVYAFVDGQPMDIFGLVLIWTGASYPGYHIPPPWTASGFHDATTGGVLLLIPGLIDLGIMSRLFILWLRQIEARTRLDDERRARWMPEEDEEWEEE